MQLNMSLYLVPTNFTLSSLLFFKIYYFGVKRIVWVMKMLKYEPIKLKHLTAFFVNIPSIKELLLKHRLYLGVIKQIKLLLNRLTTSIASICFFIFTNCSPLCKVELLLFVCRRNKINMININLWENLFGKSILWSVYKQFSYF